MFSRLAFRTGANVGFGLRNGVTAQPLVVASFHTNTKDIKRTEELILNWEACKEKYYGPERDIKNFPLPEFRDQPPPTTLGFVSREWVDALYAKTGVSGPFWTMGGLVVFIMSKEIWVIDHGFFDFIGFWGAVYLVTTKWGPNITNFFKGTVERVEEAAFNAPLNQTRQAFTKAVGNIDTEIEQEGRHAITYKVQRENVDMQLESRYRERVSQVYEAVKSRLDYQVELINTKKRLEQRHMVDWIVSNVVKGITPKQEKDAIASCIGNLQALAKAQPQTAV